MIQPRPFSASFTELSKKRGFATRELGKVDQTPILAFTRTSAPPANPPFRLYLSAGVHGDEPAGPLAIARLLEEDRLPYDADITIIPLINPTGFESQTRENRAGHDLNRDFRNPQNPETQAVKTFLDEQAPFNLSLSLHEDWESSGFYLYSLSSSSEQSYPREILKAAETAGPLDHSPEIDGSPATDGLIDRPADFDIEGRNDWPEAFLLYSMSKHAHYTLETPSASSINQRIAQHTAAALRAIELHRS